MEISLATYVVTVVIFAALLFVVLVLSKKPPKGKSDYVKLDEVEETALSFIEEIEKVGEMYVKALGEKIQEAKAIEGTLKKQQPDVETPSEEKEKTEEVDKKTEVIRLIEKGFGVDEISSMTGTHKGFVEVIYNMENMGKEKSEVRRF